MTEYLAPGVYNRSAGFQFCVLAILGFRYASPQALCCLPLRGLKPDRPLRGL